MDLDLKGRVGNTKLSPARCLHPLFEAISNSFHAIEEGGETQGTVTVHIQRDTAQQGLIEGEPLPAQPIIGFVVEDNGIGFTDTNLKAFRTSDTTRKQAKGGKGVGRFLWLKAFDKIEVESIFFEKAKCRRRRFDFALTDKGVENEAVEDVDDQPRKTTVRLLGFKAEYRKECPKSGGPIARKIIEHFLESFILKSCPKMTLHDDYMGESIVLKNLFASEMQLDAQRQEFQVKGQKFQIIHIRLVARPDADHTLSFCAHKRSVRAEPLPKLMANLEATLIDPKDEKRFLYAGYASGKYLDSSVNSERTRFDLADEHTGSLFPNEVCWQEILDTAVAKAKAYLAPFTDPINQAKKERIREYVQKEAPQFRPILKHKSELIDNLRSNLTTDQLDVELYKIYQGWDLELRHEYRKLLAEKDETVLKHDEHRERYEKFLQDWNDAGIAKLAQYVVYRKATIAFLEERLQIKPDGKYHLEDAIHELIFPLKASSDDVQAESMNLWILDEKLAYHYYLASDKPLDQIGDVVQVESKDRPDLLIFNRPFAFADAGPQFLSVVVIEFKRPVRDDYSETEGKNPISQVYNYIELIKKGEAKDRHGRFIPVAKDTPFFAYIVCDVTPTLRKQADYAQLTLTPDSQGYFGYHRNLGAYIEIISFDKLIADAERRNRILFDKLGMERQ